VNYRRIVTMFFVALFAIGIGSVAGIRGGRGKVANGGEIKPGIYGVKSGSAIYLYGARAGHDVILFDTGADPYGKPIDGVLRGLLASRPDVRDVFLTHGHFDHYSGALSFPTGVHVFLGAPDVELAAGIVPPAAIATKALTLVSHSPPLKVSELLTGPQTIAVGGGKTVKAIPVPGHTPGSFAFLFDGVLFTGDIMILKDGRLETTPSLYDAHPDENKAAIRSLKTQLATDTIDIVCTGHGGCTDAGTGRRLMDDLVARLSG
jgi:glyoxylase-like metal-dependent hydrolase (beta-lactamase superfamily II)